MKLYCEELKKIRKEKNISTNTIALKLGKSRSAVAAWENGLRNPKEFHVRKIAQILDISVDRISDLKPVEIQSPENLVNIPELSEPISRFVKFDISSLRTQHISAMEQLSEVNTRIFQELNLNSIMINALMSSLPYLIYIKDSNLKYIMANNSFLKSSGLHSEFKVMGNLDQRFFPLKEARLNTAEDEKVISTGLEVVNRKGFIPGTREKRIAYISKIPIFSDLKKVVGMIGIFNDITSEENNRLKYQLLNIAMHEKLTDGMWLTLHENDNFIYLNMAFENIFGYTIEELNNNKTLWLECIYKDEREGVYNAVMNPSKEGKTIEFNAISKSGKHKKVRLNLSWGNIEGKIYSIGTVREI